MKTFTPEMTCRLGYGLRICEYNARKSLVEKIASSVGVINFIYFANYTRLRKDEAYREALLQSDAILSDGTGMQLLSRLKFSATLTNNNGTDLLPLVLEEAKKTGRKVYFYGAKPGVNAACVERAVIDGVDARGTHGYTELPFEDVPKGAILLVALGTPKQEQWTANRRAAIERNALICIGCGGFLDFYAGQRKRAPYVVRWLRLEFLYRALRYPKENYKKFLQCFLIIREIYFSR